MILLTPYIPPDYSKTNTSVVQSYLINDNTETQDLTVTKGTNELINLQSVPEVSRKELTFAQAHELLNETRQRYQKLRELRIKADSEELNKMLED